ncbi:MAG: hypothetical protein IJ794_15910 [Lachnospiraceae bacterium]|nr:hypothetical protein [Lachnospiraceae bacterium]
MANFYGVSAYQQAAQTYNSSSNKTSTAKSSSANASSSAVGTAKTSSSAESSGSSKVETKAWSPIDTKSSLVPSVKEGYGMTIGDVELSDKAKDYYDKLKSKFHNSEFILVSKDMKSKVQQNAAAYGNANKMVVLIDEEKLERMATDESYRKKYEGIIAMSQSQMAAAKNSLASSGASVKNFGMSVNSDGTTSLFATLEKSSDAQAKRIEKKAEAKKEQKVKEKKQAEKKEQAKRLEKAKEKQKAGKADSSGKTEDADDTDEIDAIDSLNSKEYVEIRANSLDELVGKVQQYAYDNSARGIMTDAERAVGQNFDFKF